MGVVIFISLFRPSTAGIIRILPKNIKAVAESGIQKRKHSS